jgi:uncharacterized protein YbjT (DUF2867 family)
MRRALASVHTFFVIPVHESPDRVEQYVATVDAAVAAGVERIVYSSFVGAAPDATFTFARDYWHTEEHIRKSGLDFTFLRTSTWTFSPGSWAPTASSAPLPVIDGAPRWHVPMWRMCGLRAAGSRPQRRDLQRFRTGQPLDAPGRGGLLAGRGAQHRLPRVDDRWGIRGSRSLRCARIGSRRMAHLARGRGKRRDGCGE